MIYAKLKRHKDNLEVNVFSEDSKSSYNNIITRDPNRVAQVLMDLMVLGFPIEKAIIILNERIKRRDWFG